MQQEELHAISANAALKNVGVRPIQPCKHYMFPVSNYKDAVTLAAIFTDLVMGTLQDTIQRFAEGGDVALARFISSVVGQEGEQDGWYRVQQGKIPSQLPFLTTSELGFAFSYVLQRFTRPDLCPSIKEIPLPIFPGLYILTPPGAETQKIKVAWHNDPTARAHGELFITYINQQNLPVSEPLRIVAMDDMVVAEALFPYDKYLMNGLTIATITKSGGPFPDAQAVLKATLFGPGLIDFN